MRINLQTVRSFTRAIRYGSKYIYQTLPRVLTIWLDMAEDPERANNDVFAKVNVEVSRAIKATPVYKVISLSCYPVYSYSSSSCYVVVHCLPPDCVAHRSQE